MAKRGLGREQVREAAWGDSYPHPLLSCLMPLVALLTILTAGLFGFYMWQQSLPGDTTVPQVAGLKLEQAISELYRAQLSVEVMKEKAHSEEVPEGLVISSEPEAGRSVKVHRVVRLVVSAGSAFTKVPEVKELSHGEAQLRLRSAGLVIAREEYQYHDNIPFDRVIAVTPRAGTRVEKMSGVTLIISRGKEEKTSENDKPPLRSTVVSVDLPTDGEPNAQVRIDVTDDNGKRTVYEKNHEAGETLVQTVQGAGEMTIEVYYGDQLILTRKF